MAIPFVVPDRYRVDPLPGLMAGEDGAIVLHPLDALPGQQGAPCPSCGGAGWPETDPACDGFDVACAACGGSGERAASGPRP